MSKIIVFEGINSLPKQWTVFKTSDYLRHLTHTPYGLHAAAKGVAHTSYGTVRLPLHHWQWLSSLLNMLIFLLYSISCDWYESSNFWLNHPRKFINAMWADFSLLAFMLLVWDLLANCINGKMHRLDNSIIY